MSHRPVLLASTLALLFASPVDAKAPKLPLDPRATPWESLEDLVDPELQAELVRIVEADPRRRTLVRRKQLAIGVIDLREQDEIRFARINGRVPLYAASMAKLGVLLAAEEAIEDGVLTDTPEVRKDLNDMIRISSNSAATRMIDRVGLDRIEASVRRWGLYDETRGGGLWVGKRYGRSQDRRGDPVANLSHGANVVQVCRFYYLLATGRLVSRATSGRMLQDLVNPGLHHKFVASLDASAPNAQVYRKSGTFREWHSDSVLVWGDTWRRYVLVAMVQDSKGEQILRELVPKIEAVLKPEAVAPRK
ncbi:MAG: hypothetical protein DHS20C21_17910 [Gemmatimonadota bacterium]|nr:MAG: hypothetical protein DHS20C21_17910 [Gemmatimonadota bacterium]